jgi:hypothetical protein
MVTSSLSSNALFSIFCLSVSVRSLDRSADTDEVEASQRGC